MPVIHTTYAQRVEDLLNGPCYDTEMGGTALTDDERIQAWQDVAEAMAEYLDTLPDPEALADVVLIAIRG